MADDSIKLIDLNDLSVFKDLLDDHTFTVADALPTASANYLNKTYIINSSGDTAVAYLCVNNSGTYTWKKIAYIPTASEVGALDDIVIYNNGTGNYVTGVTKSGTGEITVNVTQIDSAATLGGVTGIDIASDSSVDSATGLMVGLTAGSVSSTGKLTLTPKVIAIASTDDIDSLF